MDGITPLMTIAEAAALLKVHPETIRRAVRNGKLEAYRRPGMTRISVPALQAYLDRCKSPVTDSAGSEERRSVESSVEAAVRIAKLKAMMRS